MTTDIHARVWAERLSLTGGMLDTQQLGQALGAARVDINPHQVHAAVFALQRLSLGGDRGVLLADEVGLGKTIEAGLVLAQGWAMGQRRLLAIVPAMLRKQWHAELVEKFGLPAVVVEGADIATARDGVVICSYQAAARHAIALSRVRWDLAVLDEAHRLRGLARGAVIAAAVQQALFQVPRLLLTATPLQNNLMELHGLGQLLDPHLFGDAESFKSQFVKTQHVAVRNALLRSRMQGVCVRTLRRQVQEYVRFTRRVPLTQPFMPSDDEQSLYRDVTAWMQEPVSVVLPAGQRALLTMVLHKLLASSTFAIAATLRTMLVRMQEAGLASTELPDDFEGGSDAVEEWREAVDEQRGAEGADTAALVAAELALIRNLAERAERIATNEKGTALLRGLELAFAEASKLGAAHKAVVFTESRRTQRYLRALLEDQGYKDEVVCISGVNSDAAAQATYKAWMQRHASDGVISGVKSADMRAALVEQFRDRATILVATEAASEGVNLQFCSLVVNYDLPWNPQRIEQRIGRCHRYGQRHDVVVLNFLNQRNAADARVLQLLTEKFVLFDGVFGASDEVLGAVGNGVDLERRIAEIYRHCRTEAEIHAEFDALQDALRPAIEHKLADTREQILSHFDADVQDRLRVHREQAKAALDQRQRWLWDLLRHEQHKTAIFAKTEALLTYKGPLCPHGRYHLDWHTAELGQHHFLGGDHVLAQTSVATAVGRALPSGCVVVQVPDGAAFARWRPFVGCGGVVAVQRLTVQAGRTEQALVTAASLDDGALLPQELADRLWELPATLAVAGPAGLPEVLAVALADQHQQFALGVQARNAALLDTEADKLSRWADDEKLGLRLAIEALDEQIKDVQRQVRQVQMLEEKLALRRTERDLDRQRTEKRRALFEAQDRVDAERDRLLDQLELALRGEVAVATVWIGRWRVLAA